MLASSDIANTLVKWYNLQIMTPPDTNADRLAIYRREIAQSYRFDKAPKAVYALANVALEELKMATERAEEPSEESFGLVGYRFDLAADANDGVDQFMSLRSRLLKAWIRPIVWSDIINLGTLTNGEAKRVAKNIGLGDSADDTTEIVNDALGQIDEIKETPKQKRSEAAVTRAWQISGFLGEATSILLGARHTTAKQFTLPTMFYDDGINPDKSRHFDGIYFDNRRQRSDKKQIPYQVETIGGQHWFIHRSIPTVNARLMGNLEKTSTWPHDDRPFMTARHLVDERRGDMADATTTSTLDSIQSAVFNRITRHK